MAKPRVPLTALTMAALMLASCGGGGGSTAGAGR